MAYSFSWKGKDGYFPLQHGLDRAPLDDFCAEEKGKCMAAARLFVCVFCSTKQKTNARLLSYESWQVAPRRSKWTGEVLWGDILLLVQLCGFPMAGHPNPIQMKNEEPYSKIQSSLSPVGKSQITLPGLINGWKINAINFQQLFNLVLTHGSTRSQNTFASMWWIIFWVSQFNFLLVSTVNKKPHGKSRFHPGKNT